MDMDSESEGLRCCWGNEMERELVEELREAEESGESGRGGRRGEKGRERGSGKEERGGEEGDMIGDDRVLQKEGNACLEGKLRNSTYIRINS